MSKKIAREFFVCTFFPVLISLLNEILPEEYFSSVARYTVICLLVTVNIILLFRHYQRSNKDAKGKATSRIHSIAYTNAFQLSEDRRDRYIEKTYEPSFCSTEEYPYSIKSYIGTICKNLRDSISQITNIEQEYMPVTFIYRYAFSGAGENEKRWKWITGKDPTEWTALDCFVNRKDTLYHYIINPESDSSIHSSSIIFCNDKKQLENLGHYYMSARDVDHDKKGSVFATRVVFGNNDEPFVEGVLLVSFYGKQFVDSKSDFSERELKSLIFEELYPYYQRMLEAELGLLFFQHRSLFNCRDI